MYKSHQISFDCELPDNLEKTFKSKGLCGLINKSNSCYLNSAIQCLSNTLPLTFFFINKNYLAEINNQKLQSALVYQWYRLVSGIWEENCTISPESFINNIKKLSFKNNNIFHNNQQHDVSELLNFVIDNLHEGLSKQISINISGIVKSENDKILFDSMTSWKNYFKNNYSIIIELFFGQFISIVESKDDEPIEKSYTYEPFCILDLEIPDFECNIYDCFNLLVKESLLTGDNKWYSDKIKDYRDATRNLKILNLPEILIICLKRFNNNGSKKNHLVNFPIDDLDLEKYVYNCQKINCRYSLFAICNHIGILSMGHYFAYCRNIDKNWYNYDDDTIKIINLNELISNKAYCLFYQKKKF